MQIKGIGYAFTLGDFDDNPGEDVSD